MSSRKRKQLGDYKEVDEDDDDDDYRPAKRPKISNGGEKATCPDCKKTFTRSSDLRRHYDIIHRGIKNFKCSQCPAAFSQITNLRLHLERAHKKTVDGNDIAPDVDDRIPCPECGTLFARRHDLKRHVLFIHRGFKPFRCLHCPMEYANISHLKGHSKTVHGIPDEEFDCEKLEMPDIEDEIPKVHEKPRNRGQNLSSKEDSPESPEMPRIESVKSLNFSNISHQPLIDKNQRLVHSCVYPHCDKTFTRKSDLRRHILNVHERIKPFICKLCQKSFFQITDLKAHAMAIHDAENNPDNFQYEKIKVPEVKLPDEIKPAPVIPPPLNASIHHSVKHKILPPLIPRRNLPPLSPIKVQQVPVNEDEDEDGSDTQQMVSMVQDDIHYEPTDYQSDMIEFHTLYFCAECDFKVDKLNYLLSHHASSHEL